MTSKYDLWYLASPYTHSEEKVMAERFEAVSKVTVELLKRSLFVFSPIAYNHPMNRCDYRLPVTWDFWKPYDLSFLERCTGVIVLMIDGWKESVGVTAEVQFAEEHGLPVYYIYTPSTSSGYESIVNSIVASGK